MACGIQDLRIWVYFRIVKEMPDVCDDGCALGDEISIMDVILSDAVRRTKRCSRPPPS